MNTTAKLLLHCPDQPGILAEVTNFITINRGNIVYLDQYVDHVENIFFMRIEWEIKDFFITKDKIEDYFEHVAGKEQDMAVEIIIQIGDREFWKQFDDMKSYMKLSYQIILDELRKRLPQFVVANAVFILMRTVHICI